MERRKALPNPPKSPCLTKAWAMEVRSMLTELDHRLFTSRLLERPALGLKDEWLWEMRDRMCAVLAQVNVWHQEELKKRRHHAKKQIQDTATGRS